MVVDTRTSTALADYVNAPDPAYTSELKGTQTVPVSGVGTYTYYSIDLTSQTWRSAADVNLPVWHHWLNIYVPTVPADTLATTAMLLIDGGSNGNFTNPPAAVDALGVAALSLRSVVVDLTDVPSEPLTFTDELGSRSEDEIIAYSFDKFLDNIGQPGNDTWPVLLAMTNAAVKAMDTVQTFILDKVDAAINDFLVTGYSKRGWTTWLTAAVDDRVRAIIPGVFDNLNQGPQMVHQFGVYGFFSQAVQAYNDEHIFERIITTEGADLSQIVDPYRYLNNGRFDDMPKLLIDSAGDEFFVSDSAQYYYNDIPGEKYLLYLPNVGHGLDYDQGLNSQVVKSTITFADAVLNNRPLPQYSWTVDQEGSIHVETSTTPTQVLLWHATNPDARDFRHGYNPDIVWTADVLSPTSPGEYVGDVPMPGSGATAYFVQLTFPNNTLSLNPYLKSPYVFTTEVRVKSTLDLNPWPYDETLAADGTASAATATALVRDEATPSGAGPTLSLAILAVALETENFDLPSQAAVETILPATAAAPVAALAAASAGSPLLDAAVSDAGLKVEASDDPLTDDIVDSVLTELLA